MRSTKGLGVTGSRSQKDGGSNGLALESATTWVRTRIGANCTY